MFEKAYKNMIYYNKRNTRIKSYKEESHVWFFMCGMDNSQCFD